MRFLLALFMVAGVLAAALAPGCGAGGVDGNKPDTLFRMINDLRNSSSVAALTDDPAIKAVAQAYAEKWSILKPLYPSYNGSVDNSTTVAQRMTAGGVAYTACDETGSVDYYATTASAAMANMNQSKLLNPAFTRAGVGFDSYFCDV